MDKFCPRPPISLSFLLSSCLYFVCNYPGHQRTGLTSDGIVIRGYIRSVSHRFFSALHRELWPVIYPTTVNSFTVVYELSVLV